MVCLFSGKSSEVLRAELLALIGAKMPIVVGPVTVSGVGSYAAHMKAASMVRSEAMVEAAKVGKWDQQKVDPEQRVKDYIKVSQNKNTRKAYASGVAGFVKYLEREGVKWTQVTHVQVADYLRERIEEQGVAASTVMNDRASIMDKVKFTSLQQAVEHPMVASVLAVAKVKAEQSKPKRHVSLELMTEIIANTEEEEREFAAKVGPSIGASDPAMKKRWRTSRDTLLMLLMMIGMMRESEATALRLEDVYEKEETMADGTKVVTLQIAIVQSKTDQAKKGEIVLLGENTENHAHCPVRRVRAYLQFRQWMGLSMEPSKPFFAKEDGTAFATTTPCGIMQRAVAAANGRAFAINGAECRWGEPSEYGSHSLRRGGVTTARANGVAMLDIQRHGRWKSLTVFAYIGQTAEERLAVSKRFLDSAPAVQPVRRDIIPSEMMRKLSKGSRAVSARPDC